MTLQSQSHGEVLSDRWRLNAPLGRGAMGSVFAGEDLLLERDVAIKRLAPEFASDDMMLARFRREALASSRIVHPNIVTTLDFGVHDGVPYIVMERVDGRGLDEVLAKEGPLSVERAAQLARHVALGLEAAHRHGIVHRDIKPGNVMVAQPGLVEVGRIVDFGIARSASMGPRLTQVGLAVGTPGYLAPEQLSGGEVDARADVFSLGVTMYEMLTTRLPWEATDPLALLTALLSQAPVPLSELRADVPGALADLVMAMLAPKAEHRPANAGEVARQLASFVDHPAHAPGRDEVVLAAVSLGDDATEQLAWFTEAVDAEGGHMAQSIGREVLAVLPSAEAGLRLTRSRPRGTTRPAVALHVGAARVDETGMALGSGVRAALRLARLTTAGEVLLTASMHEAIGLGWRGRLEGRGRFLLDTNMRCEVFALRGVDPTEVHAGSLEARSDGRGEPSLHWRCACGGHGSLPDTAATSLRVRCSLCSRLLRIDTTEAAQPAGDGAHPLTSIVLTNATPPAAGKPADDAALVAALIDFAD